MRSVEGFMKSHGYRSYVDTDGEGIVIYKEGCKSHWGPYPEIHPFETALSAILAEVESMDAED